MITLKIHIWLCVVLLYSKASSLCYLLLTVGWYSVACKPNLYVQLCTYDGIKVGLLTNHLIICKLHYTHSWVLQLLHRLALQQCRMCDVKCIESDSHSANCIYKVCVRKGSWFAMVLLGCRWLVLVLITIQPSTKNCS